MIFLHFVVLFIYFIVYYECVFVINKLKKQRVYIDNIILKIQLN